MVNPPIKPVDVFVYVKKQLKLIFDIPRFTIAYENMTVFFSQVFCHIDRVTFWLDSKGGK
jgi:hypothetical protein